MTENLRHYGKLNGEEVIILGHKKSLNQVLLVRVNTLSMDDQMDLRRIASSEIGQKQDYLIQLLQQEHHKAAGKDWFSYLCQHHMFKRIVASMPIKDITDMNEAQKAFYKGYGRSATRTEEIVVPAVSTRAAPPIDPSLAAILASLVESNKRMADAVEKLSSKVKAPKPKKAKAAKPAAAA